MHILIRWVLSALAIGVTAYLVPGATLTGVWPALVLAVVLGAINVLIRPVILLLTLPVNIITLGLFTFVINGVLVLFADTVVSGFRVDSFLTAIWFAIVLCVVQWTIHTLARKGE